MTSLALLLSLLNPNLLASEPPAQRPTPSPQPERQPEIQPPAPTIEPTVESTTTESAAPDPKSLAYVRKLKIGGLVTLSLGLTGLVPAITCISILAKGDLLDGFAGAPPGIGACVVLGVASTAILVSAGAVTLGIAKVERAKLERPGTVAFSPIPLRRGGGVGFVIAF